MRLRPLYLRARSWIVPALFGAAITFVIMDAGLSLQKFSPAPDEPARNPADIGRTTPNTLLVFEEWPGSPAFCRNANQLLDRLRQAVLSAGSIGDATSCSASIAADSATGPHLSLMCPLPADRDKCVEWYTAQLWVERDRRSLVNYKLRGFGWIQRSCDGSDAVYETINQSMSRGTSSTIDEVLDQCRNPERRSSRR